MKRRTHIRIICLLAGFATVSGLVTTAIAARPGWTARRVDARLSAGLRVISVNTPEATGVTSPIQFADQGIDDYPRPPLAGFSPLVAITTSNKKSEEESDYEHDLESTYDGDPLNWPADENFVIGFFDSGAILTLIAEQDADTLGLGPTDPNNNPNPYMTGNTFPIGGTSGQIDTEPSQPIGIFTAGLGAVQSDGRLDLGQVVGHSNVSVIVAPEMSCGPEEKIPSIIGTPLLSFYTTVIRNDLIREVTIGQQTYTSPDVRILAPDDPSIPVYPRSIAMELGGLTIITTASYYPDLDDLQTPEWPTMLSFGPIWWPLGGAFFATIGVLEGEPGATNPLQSIRVMVDTGAQSSIISPAMVANLNMDLLNPDFSVDVCGIGGLIEDVPGFYVDYVKINASGGAFEFSQAPFVALDLESPEGGPLAGVLGMNFFWNRNVIFDPSITGSAFLHLSEPIELPPTIVHIHQDNGAVRGSAGNINPDGPASIEARTKGITICTIQFSEDVNIQASDVQIRDLNNTMDLTWPSTFNYDSATQTLTMEWPAGTFTNKWIRIHILDSVISAATGLALDGEIYAESGNLALGLALDGELPSGDGVPGGDAQLVIGALQGDVDGNRIVNSFDRLRVNQNQGSSADIPSDVDGNGIVNSFDRLRANQNQGTVLPPP